MHIIVLVLILLVLAILAQKQPKAALILGSVLALGALLVILFTSTDNFRQGRIDVDEIVINSPTMLETYAGGYKFNARLVNQNDKFTLKSTNVSITMLDCPSAQINDDCVVIGHENERVHTPIPPGQARDVEETFNFGQVRINNNLRWQFDITDTRN